MDVGERFWAKVRVTPGCWLWTASTNNRGYGTFSAHGKTVMAARFAWELVHGPIPVGLTIEHRCRCRSCVWPEHFELLTLRENIRRGTSLAALRAAMDSCGAGHPFDDENTYRWGGRRYCRACRRERKAA